MKSVSKSRVVVCLAACGGAVLLFLLPPFLHKGQKNKPTVSASVASVQDNQAERKENQHSGQPSSGLGPQTSAGVMNNASQGSSPAATQTVSDSAPSFSVEDNLYTNARVIASKESVPDKQGRIRRVKLVETDFKYPFVRVEEIVEADPATGIEKVLRREAMVGDHIIVKLQPGVTAEQLEALNKKHGAKIRKKMHSEGTYLLAFPDPRLDTVPERVAAYSRESDLINYAEPDYIVYAEATVPNDPQFSQLWGLHNTGQTGGTPDADIDAPEAWDITTGDTNVVVGVIDTGVDYNHEDLRTNMWTNPGEVPANGIDDDTNGFVDDVYGCDFYNNDGDPLDDHNHGTHVSGTIGGVGNNAVGVAGVNWRVRIMALKFLSAGGSGYISDAVDALNYATMMRQRGVNIRLTSNSWGGGGFSQAMADAIAASGSAGMLFIAAAGNAGSNNDSSPFYPASYTNGNLIAVAATDHNDAKASFSCYGLTGVDLGAPGVSIRSTVRNNSYANYNGTSMATPHVAGVAALAWSLNPDASWQQITNAIFAGVDPIPALAGITVTGGRLNALNTLRLLGMMVIGSVPADGEVVSVPPTNFVIRFSDSCDTNTVNSSDLRVNNLPADSFALTSSDTVTFHFNSSPVTSEGAQTMFIAENALTRLRDGDGVQEWTAEFRYDMEGLAVASTVPADGSVVTLPFTNLRVSFNEPFATQSVGITDLVLSQGTVTGFTILNSNTVEYVLNDVVREGTLTMNMNAGSLTDVFGNPSAVYSGNFILDLGTVSYAEEFVALKPFGSLVYTSSVPAYVNPAGDTDSFTLRVDAAQTITVLIDPGVSLQPAVEVRDSSGTVLGSSSAGTTGEYAVIQAITLPTAELCTMTISGADATIGSYTMKLLLNATVENEQYGGPTNDNAGAAQDLDASFLRVGDGTAERAAVIGVIGVVKVAITIPLLEQDFNAGLGGFTVDNTFGSGTGLWHVSTGRRLDGLSSHTLPQNVYFGQNETIYSGGNYAKGRAVGGALISPQIRLPSYGMCILSFNHFLETEGDPDYDIAEMQIDSGSGFVTLLSTYYGTLPLTTSDVWDNVSYDLTSLAGKDIRVRFTFDTIDAIYNSYEGWFIDDVIISHVIQSDFFRFSMAAGETATLVASGDVGHSLTLELFDSATNLLAFGTATGEGETAISGFLSVTGGTCFVRVSGSDGEYNLLVTKSTAFDIEPNSQLTTSQDITLSGVAMGSLCPGVQLISSETEPNDDGVVGASANDLALANDLTGSFLAISANVYKATLSGQISLGSDRDWDFYKIFASPGDILVVALNGNSLDDPYLRLFDRDARQIAYDDDSGPGFNSRLQYSSFSYTGAYYVVADSYGTYIGTYSLVTTLTTSNLILPVADDVYCVQVNTGDTLTVRTATPADGPFEFENALDPAVELYNPSGILVASDNDSNADGRNALLIHTTATSGVYYLRLFPTNDTSGEYVLSVQGARGGFLPFQVISTSPEDGALLLNASSQITVQFNDTVLLTSLVASDLTVGGIPATACTVVDGTTVVFDLPALTASSYAISITNGAILDVQGTPVDAYLGSFTVLPPKVVASSLQEHDVLLSDALSYTARFSRALMATNINTSAFSLTGVAGGEIAPAHFDYAGSNSTLRIEYSGLRPDIYTLTLFSGDGKLEDEGGCNLDGEPRTWPIPPNLSGDTVEGGDFVVHFLVDAPSNTHYVSLTGTHTWPFTGWAGAATNIQDAVDVASEGDTVLVMSGTYVLSSQISVTRGIRVEGVNGATTTIVDGNNSTRCFYLSHTGAVVEGLTITGGYADNGGGAYCYYGGTLQNCIIKGNSAGQRAGGVYCDHGGTLDGCTVSSNSAAWYAGGVWCGYGGMLRNCNVSGNSAIQRGAGVYCYYGGILQNCVISRNSLRYAYYPGGGVYCHRGGTIQNCIISGNVSHTSGGGVYCWQGGTIENTIIWTNVGGNHYDEGSGMSYSYTCTDPLPTGPGNISDDPEFVDIAQDDYRLQPLSPCVDAGSNQTWMTTAVGLDDNPRIIGWTVDMGAYECRERILTVNSAHGIPVPSVGIHTNDYGSVLTNTVSSPDTQGTTQYVCTGWVMTGNKPSTGTGTNMTMTLMNRAVLTWQWLTNYWLEVTATNSTVDRTNDWFASDSTVLITANPYPYYHFDSWTGTTNGCASSSNVIETVMTMPRTLTAVCAANLAINGTPEWWLASYCLTNRGWNTEALDDQDDDGMSTWQEYVGDTIPTNGQSVLSVLRITPETNGIRVDWKGGRWARQYIQARENLAGTGGVWFSIYTNANLPTPVTNFIIDAGATNSVLFYRIKAER